MKNRVKITDIAKRAGVSPGTVDRVIHKRGNVSKKSREKVIKALKELKYKPNLIASILASNKKLKIAVLMPDGDNDPFWKQPKKGMQKAIEDYSDFGIELDYYKFPENGKKEFVDYSTKIVSAGYDGLIVAPIFSKLSYDLFHACQLNELPFIQINTYLKTDIDQMLSYVGQDSYASGLLAGKLLELELKDKNQVLILHLESFVEDAIHLMEKQKGFFDYFERYSKKSIQVLAKTFNGDFKSEHFSKFIKIILSQNPKIKGVFISTSRAYQLIHNAENNWLDSINIIGFDLIEENIKFLKSGKITFLINQNPITQGYLAVQIFLDFLLKKKNPKKIQYLPLDIVLKENISFYEYNLMKDARFIK